MLDKDIVAGFVGAKTLALAGASATRKRFGNTIARELRRRGYRVLCVHRTAETIDGQPAYRALSALPEPVGALILVTPPAETEALVRAAHEAGIKRIWMQQGAESRTAVEVCREKGIEVVHGHCILMFTAPSFPHTFHRWLLAVLGRVPR